MEEYLIDNSKSNLLLKINNSANECLDFIKEKLNKSVEISDFEYKMILQRLITTLSIEVQELLITDYDEL